MNLNFIILTEQPNGLIQKFTNYSGLKKVLDRTEHTSKKHQTKREHDIYMYWYYNCCQPQSLDLLQWKTYCIGIPNLKRTVNSRTIQQMEFKPGENKSLFFNEVHISKWRSKRNVKCITNEYGNEMTETRNKSGQLALYMQNTRLT